MVRTRFAPRTTVIPLNREMDIRWSPHVAMNLGPPISLLPYSVILISAHACLPCEPDGGTTKLTSRIETSKSTPKERREDTHPQTTTVPNGTPRFLDHLTTEERLVFSALAHDKDA